MAKPLDVTPIAADALVGTEGIPVQSVGSVIAESVTPDVLDSGRSGERTITGGTAASENLHLRGTSHATTGAIVVTKTGTTTTPNPLATVSFQSTGTTGTRNIVEIQSGNAERCQINMGDVDGQSQGRVTYDNATDELWLYTNGFRRVTLDSSGNLGVNAVTAPASELDVGAGAVTGAEMTAPSAPAANGFVIYAEDNGAGKTRLMVRFATGAAQQIAIEP